MADHASSPATVELAEKWNPEGTSNQGCGPGATAFTSTRNSNTRVIVCPGTRG